MWFDPASRGRYSTDASIYQIEPIGVVAPRSTEDIARTIAICREAGAPVLPRGAGTSQCGQTVGEAVVVDTSRHLDQVIRLDEEARRVTVEPGIVLDRLNAWLKPTGLFFPVDVSPANRATIGGMAGNNSCGARSIRYGNMVHNVHAIGAILADGSAIRFGEVSGNLAGLTGNEHYPDLVQRMRALGAREADEIVRRFPALLRRVGGYNIDTLVPGAAGGMAKGMIGRFTDGSTDGTAGAMAGRPPGATAAGATDSPASGVTGGMTGGTISAITGRVPGDTTGAITGGLPGGTTGAHNMAHLLVGSEGTLGFFTEIELDLKPLPAHRVLGVCHFPAFYQAMAATQHIVALGPSAVELVDRTLVDLARDIEAFRPTVERFVRGAPDALLLVEFAGEDRAALLSRLARLVELMADLGFPGAVVEAVEPGFQRAVWEVRKAGLNIMMSMKGDGEAGLVRRGLRGEAGGPRRVHPPPRRDLRPPRHPRHLVRARFGRHPARSAHHRSQGRGRRAHHAGDRRGVLRDGARVPRLPLRRARRRHRAERVPRGDVRPPAGRRVRGGQGRLRPGRTVQSRQDRPARAHGRPRAAPLQAGLRAAARRDRASTGRNGAASTARSRCATTTARAASGSPA